MINTIVNIATLILLCAIGFFLYEIVKQVVAARKQIEEMFLSESSQEVGRQVKKIPVIKANYFKDSELKK